MRKMYIDVTVRLIVEVEEGKTVDNTMDALEMTFTPTDETVEVVDATIENFNLTDSK
jgi:hypothetical protein